jgi:uncharacterized iron-regulated protein
LSAQVSLIINRGPTQTNADSFFHTRIVSGELLNFKQFLSSQSSLIMSTFTLVFVCRRLCGLWLKKVWHEEGNMWIQKLLLILSVLMAFFALSGCAGTTKPSPIMAKILGVSEHFKIGQILDLKTGTELSFDRLIDQISSKDLIFIGEVHDNPEHHLIQVQILQALVECCSPISIALEFFEKPQQPTLERYRRGELDESEFLNEVDWGPDYHFYRPLIRMAKQHGAAVLAINAPRNVVGKVARQGLESLGESERSKIAEEIDLSNEAHRTYVREAYERHPHGDLKEFEYFYEAQCVWEDTMAETLAEYLKKNGRKLIAFTGNGHIINKFGIPDRTVERIPVSMVTIMPLPLSKEVTIEKETADYVWLTADYPRRPRRHQK